MNLTEPQKKTLRGLGHHLKPVVMIGDAGATDNVRAELDGALDRHELVKVSVRVGDRAARDAVIRDLAEQSGSALVTRIGNVALLFRRNPEKPRIQLPGAGAGRQT